MFTVALFTTVKRGLGLGAHPDDKENVAYRHSGGLLSQKTNVSCDLQENGATGHCVQRSKPDTEGQLSRVPSLKWKLEF